ncbi:universal stress protein [Flavobacterium sp.]|uniref:universal stress protein n=1 Tax=Flavobacterium sp. TaxID=239 RepID=UPI00260DF1E3|nr:universal stress protein [Flavobacterium sp.]
MKKILFPTDFSEVANNAFVHALGLAKLVHGELILLHTYELPIIDNQFAPQNYQVLFDSLELSNFERFKDEVPKLRAIAEEHHFEHIQLSHMILDGDLLYNIKEIIKKDKIDYIVMGTSGATGWKEAFLGTNTGEAIVNLSVPVLSIPKDCIFTKIETIGFTTRYREKDKEALRQVIKIAKATNAKVKCLYVKTKTTDTTEATFENWKEQFKNDPVTFFVIPNEEVKESISEFIIHQEIDVLAMLTYKRSFFESLFSSSFTEKMSYNSDVPILALH